VPNGKRRHGGTRNEQEAPSQQKVALDAEWGPRGDRRSGAVWRWRPSTGVEESAPSGSPGGGIDSLLGPRPRASMAGAGPPGGGRSVQPGRGGGPTPAQPQRRSTCAPRSCAGPGIRRTSDW